MKIEITILGLLMEQNLYGYEIKKKIVERLEDYVDIKFGSIYYAIKKAVEHGWVKKHETKKDGGNPERYVYKIEQPGRKHFKKLLKQYFEHNLIHFDIDIVLMFLNNLSEDQRESFIEERRDLLKDKLVDIKKKITSESEKKDQSFIHLYTYLENHLKAENNWVKSLS